MRCFIAVCDGREAAPASYRLEAQASHLFCLLLQSTCPAKLTMTPPHLILSSRDHVVIAWTYRTMRSPQFSVAHVLPWHDVNVADQFPSGRIVATGSFVRIHPQLPQFILISLTSSTSNNQIPAGCVALNTSCGKMARGPVRGPAQGAGARRHLLLGSAAALALSAARECAPPRRPGAGAQQGGCQRRPGREGLAPTAGGGRFRGRGRAHPVETVSS